MELLKHVKFVLFFEDNTVFELTRETSLFELYSASIECDFFITKYFLNSFVNARFMKP